MKRARLPLNKKATAAANEAVRSATNGKPIDPEDPAHARLREQWLAAYERAGGIIEPVRPQGAANQTVVACTNNYLELQFLHCDGTPVGGAEWHAEAPGLSTSGSLDKNGFVHRDGVPDVGEVQVWIVHVPQKHEVKSADVPANIGQPKHEAITAFDEVVVWIWGTVEGDFNKDQSASQAAVNMVLGFIPLVDQVLDLRDIISGLKDLIEFYSESEEQQAIHPPLLGLSYETWLWIGVILIAVGCIPILGSAIKGVAKTIIRFLLDAGNAAGQLSTAQLRRLWMLCIEALNALGIQQGNAHRLLKQMSDEIVSKLDEAVENLRGALEAFQSLLHGTQEYAYAYAGARMPIVGEIFSSEAAAEVIKRTEHLMAAVGKAYDKLDSMKATANEWIAKQVKGVLSGKHEVPHTAGINNSAKSGNTYSHKATPPSELDLTQRLHMEGRMKALDSERLANNEQTRKLSANIDEQDKAVIALYEKAATARGAKREELQNQAKKAAARRDALQQERRDLVSRNREIQREQDLLDLKLHPERRTQLPCLAPETVVWTPAGACRLDKIAIGDFVECNSIIDATAVTGSVLRAREGQTQVLVEVTVQDATIMATPRHRFWVQDERSWIAARDLQPLMQLTGRDNRTWVVQEVRFHRSGAYRTINLAVDPWQNFYVGPGILVHNDGAPDYGFGDHVIYEGRNPHFPDQVYIGQTNDLGRRQGEHQAEALRELARPDLTPEERDFWEFKKDIYIEPRVTGLTKEQADFMEQKNIDIELEEGTKKIMNRDLTPVSEDRMRRLDQQISSDPKVRDAGFCQ